MKITTQELDGCQLLSLAGRLDASTAPILQGCFEGIVTSEACRFILEMRDVDYVSSGGLRVLLIMTKKVKALGGGIVLTRLHPFVEDLLRMSGFHTMIPAVATKEDAVRLLAQGARP